jgi:hypothetical protein
MADAAVLFRESGDVWSTIAGRAAEMGDSLGELADVAARRMHVVITKGAAGREEIQALSADIEALAGQLPSVDERRAFLVGLGELVDAARTIEERAVAMLSP